MLSREDVDAAFEIILGRRPESEDSYAAHQCEPSVQHLTRRLFATLEFRARLAGSAADGAGSKWVCTELRDGLKLWVDLADIGVSAGCLLNDWEPSTTAFILAALGPGDVFVDVGANIGWFTILAAHRVGVSGHVWAFEPRPGTCGRLADSVSANGFEARCSVRQVALGEAEGELELAWIPAEKNPGHSFLVPHALPDDATSLGKVAVKLLDDLVTDTRVRLIKMDVEGGELQVLKGASRIIARDRPILVFELFPQWLDVVGATRPAAVLDLVRQAGYRVFRMTDAGIGQELKPGDDGVQHSASAYFSVVALAPDDLGRFLAERFDRRIGDLEHVLSRETASRQDALQQVTFARQRAAEAEAAQADTRRNAEQSAQVAAADAAALQSSLHEQMRAREAAESDAAAAQARLVAAHAAQQDAQQRALAGKHRVVRLTDDLAATQARLQEAEAGRAEAWAAQAEADRRTAIAQQRIGRAMDNCGMLELRLAALESSTAWKVSYPMRRLADGMPLQMKRLTRRALQAVWWCVTLQVFSRLRAYAVHLLAGRAKVGPIGVRADAPDRLADPAPHAASVQRPFWGSSFVVSPSGGFGGPRVLPEPRAARVLIIDSRWPRPDRDSGSMDAVAQIRALQRMGYEVIFAGDAEFDQQSPYRDRLASENVVCLSPQMCASVENFLHTDGATLALCILSRVHSGGRYLEAIIRHAPSARIIFNTVDLHHLREEREARLANDKIAFHKASGTRERELYLVRQADATLVVSSAERELLSRLVPGATVVEMPLSRPVRNRNSLPAFAGRSGVGFVGGFDHRPNVDAASFLVRQIWPRVIAALPGARLSLVGEFLPAELAGSLPEGIDYLGAVPDLDPWLDGLRLTVAPLRYGAGAKGKVASSLAAGVPCVGTAVASEGMHLRDDAEILIGSGAGELADLICRLHEDANLWERLAEAGHAKAAREFSLEAGEKRLTALLRQLALPTGQTAHAHE